MFSKSRVLISLARGCPFNTGWRANITWVKYVEDSECGFGPMAGIQAGLQACDTDWMFVLPCDCPFISPDFLRGMASLVSPQYMNIVPRSGRDHFEPLHALYSRRLLPTVDQMVSGGHARVFDLFNASWTRFVEQQEVETWDPRQESFINLNTPKQLEETEHAWITKGRC